MNHPRLPLRVLSLMFLVAAATSAVSGIHSVFFADLSGQPSSIWYSLGHYNAAIAFPVILLVIGLVLFKKSEAKRNS